MSSRRLLAALRRYHVRRGKKRTTVSMDRIVSDHLALHLGHAPNTDAAHSAVRAWLQAQIDGAADPGRIRVSQWLLGEALTVMITPSLARKYADYNDTVLASPMPAMGGRKPRS